MMLLISTREIDPSKEIGNFQVFLKRAEFHEVEVTPVKKLPRINNNRIRKFMSRCNYLEAKEEDLKLQEKRSVDLEE